MVLGSPHLGSTDDASDDEEKHLLENQNGWIKLGQQTIKNAVGVAF